jgi:hypothetical protein
MKSRNELGRDANGERRELRGKERELRKVVTSEGLGTGERRHLRLLPAIVRFIT